MARSVSGPIFVGSGRVRVSVTDFRLAQKVYGGTIRPKTAKALTIPVAPGSLRPDGQGFPASNRYSALPDPTERRRSNESPSRRDRRFSAQI